METSAVKAAAEKINVLVAYIVHELLGEEFFDE